MTLLDALLTPDRRAEAKQEQDRLRERHGQRLAFLPAQASRLWGLAREQVALAGLQAANTDERKAVLYNQLAEGLAAQGRFDSAAAFALDGVKKVEYRERADAVAAVGSPRCACPQTFTVASKRDAKGEIRESKQAIEKVTSENGQAVITISRCLLCNALSAYAE